MGLHPTLTKPFYLNGEPARVEVNPIATKAEKRSTLTMAVLVQQTGWLEQLFPPTPRAVMGLQLRPMVPVMALTSAPIKAAITLPSVELV